MLAHAARSRHSTRREEAPNRKSRDHHEESRPVLCMGLFFVLCMGLFCDFFSRRPRPPAALIGRGPCGARCVVGRCAACPSSRTAMTDVTIERVDTIALRIPYDHWAPKPTFGGIARDTMDCLLVRVTASNGMVGWGEAFWGGWQATQAAIEHWVAPLAVGQRVTDVPLTARFERALHNFGRSGPYRLRARRPRHRAVGPARQDRRHAGLHAARRQASATRSRSTPRCSPMAASSTT